MASQAETNGKRLADELAKPIPDDDVVYALRSTQDYWNTVDTDKLKRGNDKIGRPSLIFEPIARLNQKQDVRKIGTIFGMVLMVDMTDVPAELKDDRYYQVRRAYDEVIGIKKKANHGSQEA